MMNKNKRKKYVKSQKKNGCQCHICSMKIACCYFVKYEKNKNIGMKYEKNKKKLE